MSVYVFACFVKITRILLPVGVYVGLDENCREKQFDMKKILICPADLDYWRSTRFLRWIGFREGV
jgi:hypothetical protein